MARDLKFLRNLKLFLVAVDFVLFVIAIFGGPLTPTSAAAPIGVLLGIIVLGKVIANKSIDFVTSFSFPDKAKGVLIRERPDLSPEFREKAWDALRQYFWLHAHNSERFLGMPSETADAAWHAFMLCTNEYEDFCKSAFGRFLHHVPDENARPCTMGSSFVFKKDVIATWNACIELRKTHPELALTAIPLLFSLDTEAGRGWVHTDDSLRALEQQAALGYAPSKGHRSNNDGTSSVSDFSDSAPTSDSGSSCGGASGAGYGGGSGCGGGGGGCGGGCGGCGGGCGG